MDRLEAMNYIWNQSVLRAAWAHSSSKLLTQLTTHTHTHIHTQTHTHRHRHRHIHTNSLRGGQNKPPTKNKRTAFNILNPEKSYSFLLPPLFPKHQTAQDGWRRSHLFCPSNESRALLSTAKTASDKAPQAASPVLDIQALLLFI